MRTSIEALLALRRHFTNLDDYIEIRSGVRSGKPCFKGTRITACAEYMASGMSEGELLDSFPALSPEHLRAALAFATARERRLAAFMTA